MDTFTEYKPIKQRLFLTLHIGIKNITDKASSNYIRTQNAERERYYRYQIPINNVLVSNHKLFTLFPYTVALKYSMLSDDLSKITPNVPQDISLLQAAEYLAFGWFPGSEQDAKLFGQKRYYETEPGSPDGQDQIKKLEIACGRLEVLLLKILKYNVSGKDAKPANKIKEPKVVFDNSCTSFITLTDSTTLKSFNDATVNFYDLIQCVNHLNTFKENPTTFRLFLDGNELKLQKNSGYAKTIHRFNTKFNSYDLMKYIMAKEGHIVSIDDPIIRKLIPGDSSNFMTNLKRVFEDNDKQKAKLKKAVKQNFFNPFSTDKIMFKSTVSYAPELDE